MTAEPLAPLLDAPILRAALPPILFLGATAGNAVLFAFSLNWLYGQLLPHAFLKIARYVCYLLIPAFPGILWLVYGFDLPARWATAGRAWWLADTYLAVCWFLGLVIFPMVTLQRLLRARPGPLQSNHTRTVDVAAKLGYKPVGHGRYRHMARLPFNQVFQVDIAERTYRLANLPPAWDGLTILHLSDLHLCGTPDRIYYREVIDLCREPEPDLVAVTGDIVDSHQHHRWVVPVLGRLRWRIAAYAILGNHDTWHDPALVRRRLKRVGMNVLGNSWEKLEVRGHPLLVIGNETPWVAPAPDLSACPSGVFRLCLSHTPDNMPWARRHAIDLMLAGHNHGGQVRFPIIGSVFVPSRYSRRYDCGTFHEPPTLLHVSRGLAGKEPLRYNCRPEVTRIILRRGR
jgi:uncharacterized protein